MELSAAILAASLVLPAARVEVGKTRRAAARFDEDVFTLAGEACLEAAEAAPVQALLLATTSAPWAEGGTAFLLGELLDFSGLTMELGGSATAGAEALVAGMALVQAGWDPVLVVAADVRHDPEGQPLGAGAAALLLGREGDVGVLRFQRAQSGWFPDLWRLAGSSQVIIGDRSLAPVSAAAAAQWEGMAVASATGWEIERAGNLGAAGLLAMMLLEMPAKGRTKEFAAAASGSVRTFLLEGGPGATAARRRAERVRQGGIDVDRLPTADISGFNPYASQPRYWRELAQDLRLQGVRDAETGEVFFPPVPARGRPVEPFRLQRRGRILTYTRDHVYPLGGPMSMVVVELDGGGRFYGQTAWDFPVEIGMRVRLVPRLLHRGGDLPHYFWKVVAD